MRAGFSWGFADQAISSATSLCLTIAAARTVGPAGLGVVAVGFTAYVLGLGIVRASVSEPLVARTSASGDEAAATRAATTTAIALAVVTALVVTLAGSLEPAGTLEGLWLFGPWLAPALVHYFLRSVAFRDNRGAAATLADAAWLITLIAVLVAWPGEGSERTVSMAWGLGSAIALGVLAVGLRPGIAPAAVAVRWFANEALPFARWLLAETVIFGVCSLVTVAGLSQLIGAESVGGWRAVESAFSPLSLIAPAIGLPGLPLMVRTLARSSRSAWRLASLLGVAVGAAVGVYALILYSFRGAITSLFGSDFSQFLGLVWPVGLGQLALAFATGYIILLKAKQRGRDILISRGLTSIATMVVALSLGASHGIEAALWGMALSVAAGTAVTAFLAHRDGADPAFVNAGAPVG